MIAQLCLLYMLRRCTLTASSRVLMWPPVGLRACLVETGQCQRCAVPPCSWECGAASLLALLGPASEIMRVQSLTILLVLSMQPLTFTAGKKVMTQEKQAGESAGGLFSGQSGPKPPPALSKAVIGMKQGGKRSVLVPPEQGYGSRGLLEIPPDATFELRIEVLSIGGRDNS